MHQTYDAGSEKAVLACCLHSQLARTKAREALTGADFYEPLHEEIFDAMNRLDRQDMAVDGPALMAIVVTSSKDRAARLLPDLITYPVMPESVETHCSHVRQWAQKRRLWAETLRCQAEIVRDNVDIIGLAASTATRFAAVRDTGTPETLASRSIEELLLEVDPEPDWVIPNFLERGDRFVISGSEGSSKSHWSRQVVILASAGLHPFRPWQHITPARGMIIDFENSARQIRRRLQGTYEFALKGRGAPGLASVLTMQRGDITSDRMLSRIHRELDASQPEIVAMGPLYRMSPRALQTDDEAGPVLAALDTIRDRGITLVIEVHAGHATTGHGDSRKRDLRPRGSSALMGWPEFGYGIQRTGEKTAILVPWRGDRDLRDFPLNLVENGWGWEEQRTTNLADYWRGKEDWTDLAEGEG